VNSGTATYVYDSEGHRVGTVDSTRGQVSYYYDLDAHIVFEGSTGRIRMEYYVGGRHLVTYSATTVWNFPNWLGTEHFRSTITGSQYEYCLLNPFGDAMNCQANEGDLSRVHFTGKERDSYDTSNLTNLDNFGARYYFSNMARFMSPDPSGIRFDGLGDPQQLNLFSYVRNSPATATDPDGLDCIYINNDTGAYEGFNRGDCDNSTAEKANSGYYVDGTVTTIFTTTGNDQGAVTGYNGTSDSGAIIQMDFHASPGPSLADQQIYAFANLLNQWNIQANTFKIYGAGAFIGATGGAACYYFCPEAGITTLGLEGAGEAGATPGQAASISRTAAQGGRKAVERALRSLEERLATHEADLANYKAAGGYTSSVESEINNFKGLIQAAQDWLSKNP
jgi:RHS repeat-associated protein